MQAGAYASGQIDTLRKHLDTAKSLKPGKKLRPWLPRHDPRRLPARTVAGLSRSRFRASMNPPHCRICAVLRPRSRPKVVPGAQYRGFSCPVIYDFASPLLSFSQVFRHRLHHRILLQTCSTSLPRQPLRPLPRKGSACRDPPSRRWRVSTGFIVWTAAANAGSRPPRASRR